MPRTIEPEEAKAIARGLLGDFKELPGFRGSQVTAVRPIYDKTGAEVEYYEVKFSSPRESNNGYAIVSATEKDFPVVEFSEKGLTHFERFQNRTGSEHFKMVRFGPNYMTAEDPRGRLLAEIGDRPLLIPRELQKHVRNEVRSETGAIKQIETPQAILARIGKKSGRLSYSAYKKDFKKPQIKPRSLQAAWGRTRKTRTTRSSNCQYDYYWADGFSNHPYYLQIPKNTAPNNNDHASGCGPTGWMNLCGWHDLNWTPNLLVGARQYSDAYINTLTMACHDFIGTYEPWFTFGADQGFTWPDDMGKGINFARQYFHHACSYWWRQDWWDTDEEWVFEVARDVIRAKRPFIVGYYQDWHYAIGYGVAECRTHGWRDHSWIKIYPAWSTNDSQDKWIPKSTIYGVYGVYSFFPLLQFAGIENPQELEIGVGGPSDANRLFAFSGTAVFNSQGALGSSWYRDSISFEVGRAFSETQFKKAVAMISLASIANAEHAVNAGWAVDRVRVTRDAGTGKPRLTVDYAIRDIDGYLYRIGYKVSVLAKI